MKQYHLQRLHSTDFAVYGQIVTEEQKVLCVTLERPWLDNQHDVSCIPPGEYPAHRILSPKRGYEVFMLSGVPDRANIELHIGNLPRDSEGCILLGTHFGPVNGQPGITESAPAFRAFMRALSGEQSFTLEIVDPVGSSDGAV